MIHFRAYPLRYAVTALAVGLAAALPGRLLAADEAQAEFFEKQVRPILTARCYECHSGKADKPKGGLRLDSQAAAVKGGDTGPAVVPGKPKDSLLVDAINYGELYQMPPKSRLPAEEVAALTKWVEMGAPWPAESVTSSAGYASEFNLAKRKAEHWCWQPIKSVLPPQLNNEAWIKQPIDRFILSKLEERGLSPAPPAEQYTLIRRAYFDLIGLPPPPEELQAKSYEALVDGLLASPHFGERWGRHWLDLVRYSESRGHEFDYEIPNAFEYRDYVVRALNADVPYDQFLIEHVAGDLLAKPRLHPTERFNESIIGTGFWFLGEWCHSPVDIRKDECDRIDNMLDVFSKTFLGVTVACARCHNHKFDAISQQDYYALAGYLQSASYRLARFETCLEDKRAANELASLDMKHGPLIAQAMAAELQPRFAELAEKMLLEFSKGESQLDVTQADMGTAETIIDYENRTLKAWMADELIFGLKPIVPGQILLRSDPAAPLEVATFGFARRDSAWGDLGLGSTSQNDPGRLGGWLRAGRTLKTPKFTLKNGVLHYLIEGVGHVYAVVDSHAMINGPLHAELLKETGGNSDLPTRWITHDLSAYIGHRIHLEFSPKELEDFRVLKVAEGNVRPPAPAARPNQLLSELAQDRLTAEECRDLIISTLAALVSDRIRDDPRCQDGAAIANWLTAQLADAWQVSPRLKGAFADYLAARDAIIAKVKTDSRLCMAMWEGTAVDEHLLIRGNHKTVGRTVERRLPEALQAAAARDRLELAQQLIEPPNPLVSRVIVNRVWQHLLGRGIVPSVDNFGVLGEAPTHPELLDYLADEFMRDGWSVKRLIRRIMLSSTYQMASRAPPRSGGRREPPEADPQNLLFHRQNMKRLEGEALRDAILAVSGQLNRSMYGPSVPIYLTPFMQGRGRPKDSGPLDGAGRRSIYIAVRRNFLSPIMLAFDTPIPFSTIGRRNVSNVPAQALILMNDPFVAEQSRHWARRVLAGPEPTPDERIRRMFAAAFSREPTAPETTASLAFLKMQAREYGNSGDHVEDERVWSDLAHMLFNVKEFLLVN